MESLSAGMTSGNMSGGLSAASFGAEQAPAVWLGDMHELFVEGWRMSALLLDQEPTAPVPVLAAKDQAPLATTRLPPWGVCSTTFARADPNLCGVLDPASAANALRSWLGACAPSQDQ